MGGPAARRLQVALRVPPRRDLLAFLRQPAEAQERDVQFAITARGTSVVRGRTLVLRPRSGTIERHDPDDPSGDFKRPVDKRAQRYEWSVRGAGDQAKLTLTIGGSLAVTYRRR